MEIAIVIAAVVAGLIFLASENWPSTEEAAVHSAAATGLEHSDFVRLNTTDLEYPVPTGAALAGTTATAAVDPFAFANVESYGWLNGVYEETYGAGSTFAEMNIGSYDWINEVRATNSSVDPGFITMNVDSYSWLNAPTVTAAQTVDPGFITMNVDSYNGLNTAAFATPVAAAVAVDPGFMAMNVDSYDGLDAIFAARRAVDPAFIVVNVGSYDWLNGELPILEWIQQPSGPR